MVGVILEATAEHQKRTAIKHLCALLGISRSALYREQRAVIEEKEQGNTVEIRDAIQRIALLWSSYGYRRITAELQRRGFIVNHKRVLRLMRSDNLLCLRKRTFVHTTRSDPRLPVYPNLTKGLVLNRINQLWVADITYIRLADEFVYLAVILDAFSRRIIGWELATYLDSELTLAALRMALKNRSPLPADLIHHSDRGMQYAASAYTQLLQQHGIAVSMSRVGNPYDNAKAERFMWTLKREEVYVSDYQNLRAARKSISHFLETVYNQQRLHSALGYRPPAEFEQSLTVTISP
jgi:putative transposase